LRNAVNKTLMDAGIPKGSIARSRIPGWSRCVETGWKTESEIWGDVKHVSVVLEQLTPALDAKKEWLSAQAVADAGFWSRMMTALKANRSFNTKDNSHVAHGGYVVFAAVVTAL
jgi:hypothetical protein